VHAVQRERRTSAEEDRAAEVVVNWSDERYVRLYTRDTVTWKVWSFEARTVFMHMVRKADRAGVIDTGGRGIVGLAALIEVPIDFAKKGITELLTPDDDGQRTVEHPDPSVFVIVNFIEAQEAKQSDAHRQRECRERRRDLARRGSLVTKRDMSRNVTDDLEVGHETNRTPGGVVTPSLAVPSRPEPRKNARRKSAAPEGYERCVEMWFRLFEAANRSKPTWGAKHGAQLKRLLAAHDANEVARRMHGLFTGWLSWPAPPYDFGTFVLHFDKIVEPSRAARTTLTSGRFEPRDGLDYSKPPWEES
jgi:hypothetical protein